MKPSAIYRFLKETVTQWSDDHAPMLGAALAYYGVFSLGPLLLIVVSMAGFLFGKEQAQRQVFDLLLGLVGEQGAEVLSVLLANAFRPQHGVLATAVGVISLLMGAAGVFGQIQDALNLIWKTPPRPNRGLRGTIRDQVLQVLMVLAVGFLLMLTLLASAVLSALNTRLSHWVPEVNALWHGVQLGLTFAFVTLLFGLMFKYLPNLKLCWKDIWIGAVTTALLFTLGEFGIGLYLVLGAPASLYGAASSLVALMLWMYYSAQIFFFGAEMTKVYAQHHGSLAPTPGEPPGRSP